MSSEDKKTISMFSNLITNISKDIKKDLDKRIDDGLELNPSFWREITEKAVLAHHLFTEHKIKYLIDELEKMGKYYEEFRKSNKEVENHKGYFISQEIISFID